jgi:ankyrin repeat protein
MKVFILSISMLFFQTTFLTAADHVQAAVKFAPKAEDIQFLEQAIKELDEPNKALFRSAVYGDISQMNQALAKGASIDAKDENKSSALHWATSEGHEDAMRYLILRGAKKNAQNVWGRTPLHYAVECGHADIINFLIAIDADVHAKTTAGETPLHYAACKGHVYAINALVARGADVHAKTNSDWTPLYCAAWHGQVGAIDALVACGADVHAKTKNGNMPLHCAAEKGQVGAINALVAHKADVNAEAGEFSYTPLHCAAEKGQVGAIKALVAHGADVHAGDKHGITAFERAILHEHITAAYLLLALDSNQTDVIRIAMERWLGFKHFSVVLNCMLTQFLFLQSTYKYNVQPLTQCVIDAQGQYSNDTTEFKELEEMKQYVQRWPIIFGRFQAQSSLKYHAAMCFKQTVPYISEDLRKFLTNEMPNDVMDYLNGLPSDDVFKQLIEIDKQLLSEKEQQRKQQQEAEAEEAQSFSKRLKLSE